ncbi:MAG TPA: hypothetical protein VIF09_25475 [Polyangiaceae bacterium]
MRVPKLVRVAVLVCCAALCASRTASAKDVEIVAVMWQQDLSAKATVEQFFGCLTTSSSFGTTWAQQFGLTSVTFKGVFVLPSACPQTLTLDTTANAVIEDAFGKGLLPAPSPGYKTSYLLYLPQGTTSYDPQGNQACAQSSFCGVHDVATYQGTQYDAALVPIDCPPCGTAQVTGIGEHEAAEAIANMGTSTYEVGDDCENQQNHTELACCGTQYPIQDLASSKSQYDCQRIVATGAMCGCAAAGNACTTAADCCSGLACNAKVCGAPEAPDAGPDPGGRDAGTDAGIPSSGDPPDAGSSPPLGDWDASVGGADASSGGGGVAPGGPSEPSGTENAATAGDGGQARSGCGCSEAGAGTSEGGALVALAAAIALACGRRAHKDPRRRSSRGRAFGGEAE